MGKVDAQEMQIVSRSDAKALGLKHYFTGKQCARGHLAGRRVSNSQCTECNRLHEKKWQAENDVAFREGKKRWRDKNLERLSAYRLDWRKKNLEKDRAALRQWMANNPGAMNTLYAKRRAVRQKALPPWADMQAIRQIYREAKKLGMHVDHIIPLRGKLVCGLHVENNLQLLTREENTRKRNHFNPEEFEWRAESERQSISKIWQTGLGATP